MSEASKLRRTIADMEFELSILGASLARAKKEEMVKCLHCELKTKVKNTTLLKFHYYESPHGCSGGDSWGFKCYATVCDKCLHAGVAYADDEPVGEYGFGERHYDFIYDHLDQFGEVLEVHNRDHIGWFYMKGATLQEIIEQSRENLRA